MACNCIVIVREVWDTRDLSGSVLDGAGEPNAAVLTTRFEPEDLNALEAALRLKDEQGGQVTAIAIGQPGAVDVLRECLYRGTDAVLRVDADPRTLDTAATAALLAQAVAPAGPADLVLVGVTVCEGENALLGSHLAAALDLPQASYVDAVVRCGDGTVVAKRGIEMGYEDVELPTPALLSMGVALVEDDPRTPRSAKAMLKLKAKKVAIPVLSPDSPTAATTLAGAREAVPERVIESQDVDGQDETALKAMLDAALKGD